jgi:hypothetical protein
MPARCCALPDALPLTSIFPTPRFSPEQRRRCRCRSPWRARQPVHAQTANAATAEPPWTRSPSPATGWMAICPAPRRCWSIQAPAPSSSASASGKRRGHLREALRLVPGVQVQDSNGTGGSDVSLNLSVRGLTARLSPRSYVLQDGVPSPTRPTASPSCRWRPWRWAIWTPSTWCAAQARCATARRTWAASSTSRRAPFPRLLRPKPPSAPRSTATAAT